MITFIITTLNIQFTFTMSCKIINAIKKMCIEELKTSENKYLLGSVIFKGGKILGKGVNEYNRTSFLKCNNFPAIHAEMSCMIDYCNKMKIKFNLNYYKKNKNLFKNVNLMVVRISKDGNFVLSKPCIMCLNIMKYFGIKKIYYIDENEKIKKIKNSDIINNLTKISNGLKVLKELDLPVKFMS